MLLAKDHGEETAFLCAARYGQTEVLQKLSEWSTEKLSAEEVGELLLAKDHGEETAFHIAAQHGESEVLQYLW